MCSVRRRSAEARPIFSASAFVGALPKWRDAPSVMLAHPLSVSRRGGLVRQAFPYPLCKTGVDDGFGAVTIRSTADGLVRP
jgi:hypothetical protein